MNGYISNIENATKKNSDFRRVLYTTPHSQLVLMTLQPGEEIGMEVHKEHDQFIRVESGEGKAILDAEERPISDGSAIVIPAGTKHNVVNASTKQPLKLYTLYTPPEHKRDTRHRTKADADADQNHHFDGKTSL